MKKLLIASTLALASVAASAWTLGLNAGRDFAGADRNTVGISAGTQFGPVSSTVAYDRTVGTGPLQNRFSLTGGYELLKAGPVAVTAKLGGAYLNNVGNTNGFAVTYGAGFSMPVLKHVNAVLDVTHQHGQNRVEQYNGTRMNLGMQYAF